MRHHHKSSLRNKSQTDHRAVTPLFVTFFCAASCKTVTIKKREWKSERGVLSLYGWYLLDLNSWYTTMSKIDPSFQLLLLLQIEVLGCDLSSKHHYMRRGINQLSRQTNRPYTMEKVVKSQCLPNVFFTNNPRQACPRTQTQPSSPKQNKLSKYHWAHTIKAGRRPWFPLTFTKEQAR